ncbi:MAG: DNA polymerase IV [Candidatus Omnitrophica bacterium]|nr:DNA polymerase IV [Candidatus Omnitrophota bacterium]
MILHIDMDAFFASIEQVINPRLRGRPLIVGSRPSRLHTVVCAASYEAKAYGIDSGMPSKEAFQICPNLAFVPAQQSRYIWTSEQILELLKGYSFGVSYTSIDEFQMDIRDTPEPETMAQGIQKRIQEAFKITASIGIAKNCLLAKLASKINKPNGIAIITETNLGQILAKVPVQKLCGVGEKLGQVFDLLGVKTCLDLYQKSAHFLEQNLGKNGLNLYLSLHPTDHFDGPEDDSKPKSIGHSYTLPRTSENTGFIQAWIRLLSEMVARRLREQNLLARTVHLWLNGPEIGYFGAQKTYKEAINDGYDICHRCLKIIAKKGKKMPKIRAFGVTCSGLIPAQYPPLFKEQKRREELIKAVDKINACHGENAIYPAVVVITRKMR